VGWSKKQYIEQAFESIGLAAYIYDLSTDQLNSAAIKLDAMLAGWNSNGVRIGWPAAANPKSIDLDSDTKSPDVAHEAIYLNLAIRIAPGFGKQIPPEISQAADTAYSNLLNQTAAPTPTRKLPNTMPRGAGNKPHRYGNGNPFMNKPDQTIDAGSDSEIIFE